MSTHITDLFDEDLFRDHIRNKNVSIREHPERSSLVIANYTQSVQYNVIWDEVTLSTRGLIFDRDTGEVVARPWQKFFNHNQSEAPDLSNSTSIEVTDKMDGSLIIGYRDLDGELRASTKGSFSSEMVPVAEDIMSSYNTDIDPEWTPLFEVIYPSNRIVVNYQGTRDLFLLGAVNISTGEVAGPHDDVLSVWDGPRTTTFDASSFTEVLSMTPRENAEGVIVRDTNTGDMVKIKQEDYIVLHRVLTNVSTLHIWEHLYHGTIEEMIEVTPDELYDELHSYIDELTTSHRRKVNEIVTIRDEALSKFGISMSTINELDNSRRGEYVRHVKGSAGKNANKVITATFSPGNLEKSIWKQVRPTESERRYLGTFHRNN